jgi:hypothetical protein
MLTLSLILLAFCSTGPKPYIFECIILSIQELFLGELFSGPRLRSWSFRFCVSILLLAFLSVHYVSPHRRFHKPRRISTLKMENIIFCVYLLDHNLSYEYRSSIRGRLQDGAKVEDFKYLSKGKIFLVPTLSLSPLCPRTNKRLIMGEG